MRARAFCVLALCLAAPAQAPVPSNDGWVTDHAKVLSQAQEAELEKLMESYRAGSGHAVAVLTLRDLGGRALEELALATARAWKIGQRDLHDGALLLVAVQERRMRIEVGRGLEGVLTDATCGRIIRDTIAPRLRKDGYYQGIRAGVVAIHAAAGGGYAEPGAPEVPALGMIVFGLFFATILLLALTRGHRRSRRWPVGPAYRGSWLPGYGGFSHGRGGGFSGGGFSGFGGGGGFSGGGASGGW